MNGDDDVEDTVFEEAVRAALAPVRGRDLAPLRHTLEAARPWVMAQAQSQWLDYRYRAGRVASSTVRWAERRPVLWRWVFVVAIPTIVWVPMTWALRMDQVLAVQTVLVVLVCSLVGIGSSYTGWFGRGIGRAWAWFGLASPMWAGGTALVGALGWTGAWWLAPMAAGFFLAVGLESAVETVLPTRAMTSSIVAAQHAFEMWRSAVLDRGVLPMLRAELRSNEVVLGTELNYRDPEGLQQGGSLIAHQPVPSGRKLAGLVRGLNGGSFALAGPRGAGKTSLLQAFCEGAYREPKQPIALAIMVSAPVDYVPREFVLHLYARTCRVVLWKVEEIDPDAVKEAGRRERWWRPLPSPNARLVQLARQGLRDIAYVQTRSGEASGKFGFRGAEISYKRGVSLAGRPATYPELVDDFRSFVRVAANTLAPTPVVIAIDEMDRIGGGESARRFLNEIKAIFDVPGCYYLMSVSTEAQHDFELAGMGLRSVFDSSFDEVVRVDFLDYELAKGLISRSVEGLPDAFVALAYVFSGGLARQLTRSARAIVRQDRGTRLAAVAGELIADELERVCKTTGDALTASESRDGVSGLLRLLADPSGDLREFCRAIQTAYRGEDAAIRNLRDLAAARVGFLAVVRDYFTNDLAEVVPAHVNALARARRYAGSNPATGLALLEEFSAATPARPAPAQSPQ